MQLVAYGAQDVYLTGNPMITYFKVVYRRHTNFAMESISQTFSGKVAWGSKVTALISRNGDLIKGMTLEINLPALVPVNGEAIWMNDVGHHIIQQVEVEIGGQLIDRHYSDWLEIWAQLTVPADKKLGYRRMIGQDPADDNGGNTGLQALGALLVAKPPRKLYVPLQFWFCRNVGLSLPLIALQYHEVKVNFTFNTVANLVSSQFGVQQGTPGDLNAELWVDYIYLDTDERRRFAQVSHEYLIEQLQFTGDESYRPGAPSKSINLNFNHPVKELVWIIKDTPDQVIGNLSQSSSYINGDTITADGSDNFCCGNANGVNPIKSAILKLNGHDRFAVRDGTYFNWVQPFKHHTCIPDSPGINVYSFALKPEEHQPSGTCNFSRIDNAILDLTFDTVLNNGLNGGVVKVFATNYNVLRIMSGMGGLAYSN